MAHPFKRVKVEGREVLYGAVLPRRSLHASVAPRVRLHPDAVVEVVKYLNTSYHNTRTLAAAAPHLRHQIERRDGECEENNFPVFVEQRKGKVLFSITVGHSPEKVLVD